MMLFCTQLHTLLPHTYFSYNCYQHFRCSPLVFFTLKGVLIFCPSPLFVEIPHLSDYFDEVSSITSDGNYSKNNQNETEC